MTDIAALAVGLLVGLASVPLVFYGPIATVIVAILLVTVARRGARLGALGTYLSAWGLGGLVVLAPTLYQAATDPTTQGNDLTSGYAVVCLGAIVVGSGMFFITRHRRRPAVLKPAP